MSTVFSKDGFRRLLPAWVILGAAAASAVAIAWGSHAYLQKERRDGMVSKRELAEAQARVAAARRERDDLKASSTLFEDLVKRGILNEESRIDLVERLAQHRLLGGVVEAQAADPVEVGRSPRVLEGRGPLTAVTQEELAQAVAGPQLVFLRRFAGADEIPQRLMSGIGHPHGRQVAGPIAAGQFLGIPAVGLHAVARLHGHQRRGDDVTVRAQADQLPVQPVAGGPRLVATPQGLRRPQVADQPTHGVRRMGNHAERPDFSVPFGDGHRDRGGMDIEPDKSYGSHGPTLLSHAALPRGVTTLKVTRDQRNGARSFCFRHVDSRRCSLGFVHGD